MVSSWNTAFKTSLDGYKKEKYHTPDNFDMAKKLYTPFPGNSIGYNFNEKENFGNIKQTFPPEFYDADLETSEEYLEDNTEQIINCEQIIEHVLQCDVCKRKCTKNSMDIPDNIINAILFTILGIFLLFLIHIFTQLGIQLGKLLK